MDISGLELVPSPPQRFAHKELWVELSSFQVQGECHVFRPPDTANKQGRKPKHTYGPGPRKTHTHTLLPPVHTHTHTHDSHTPTRTPSTPAHTHTHTHPHTLMRPLFLYSHTHTPYSCTHTRTPPIPAHTHTHAPFSCTHTRTPSTPALTVGLSEPTSTAPLTLQAGKAEEGSGGWLREGQGAD